VLVNSADTITKQTIAAMPAADWDRVTAVNLRGPFNGIQAVIPHMRKRGGGTIVNVASVARRRICHLSRPCLASGMRLRFSALRLLQRHKTS
jgi:NAD(P)-dependent dehydrogenase (short-subunit alcohol dehydrogenase family)